MFHGERLQLISQDIAQEFSSEIYSTKNRIEARIGYHVFYYKIKTSTLDLLRLGLIACL
jgi:hypothetical protein